MTGPPTEPMPSDAPSPTPNPTPGTAGQPERDARVLALAEYLRTNRGTFTDEALRRAAADAGYDEREIAAAWAVSAETVHGRKANARSILTVIGYFVGVFVVGSLLALVPETTDAESAHLQGAVQLWPHRHGTDAMFMALLRRSDLGRP